MNMQMTSNTSMNSQAAATKGHVDNRGQSLFAKLKAQIAQNRDQSLYMKVLTWLFVCFNAVRVFSYLPTIFALVQTGQSNQYSLMTWMTWMGANATMACMLWEKNDRRVNMAIMVQIGNAIMCAVTVAVIGWFRF